MPTTAQESTKRSQIAERATSLRSEDYRKLYRTEELGNQMGFEAGAAAFERTYAYLSAISIQSLAKVPWETLERIEQYLHAVKQVIDRIRAFQVASSSNPVNERNAYIAQLDSEYRDLFREAPAAMLVLIHTSEKRDDASELSKAKEEFDKVIENLKQKLDPKAKEAEEIIEKMRAASGQYALQKYATFFETESATAARLAKHWLIATVVTAGLSLVGLGILVWILWDARDKTPTQLIQSGGAKVALFSITFYALSWCGRNFKAQWHIHVINKHRANTLNAMEAFANSAAKTEVREAILMNASSAIFTQVSTGFIPDASDGPSMPTMFEIIRGGKS